MYRLLLLVPLIAVAVLGADQSGDKVVTNSLGMKFVRVEPGEFLMGQGDAPPKSREEWLTRDEDESPAHKVTLSKAFHLGVTEVTNAQYERFDPDHKALRGKFGNGKDDDQPVTGVTWKQADDFCRWLSKQEGKTYRLPTEAEWEYACRAGTKGAFSTGDTLTAEHANFGYDRDGKTKLTSPSAVGKYAANPWGLHDLHGNVAEWCADWYGPYPAEAQTDPVGRIDGDARVVRGWSYLVPSRQNPAHFCRSANRSGLLPEDANRYTGFRVVLGDAPTTKPLPLAEAPLNRRDVKQAPAPKGGPDEKTPYFVNYSEKMTGPTMPANSWGPIFGNHNHYSAACVCPNGDVLVVWYTCVGEPDRQLAQAASRLRAGADRWETASLFFGISDINCHAPVLLRDGDRIWHFSTQSLHGWDYATDVVRYSDDSGATWSKPTIMVSRDSADALSQPCSAFVTKDGTLVVACDGDLHRDERLILSGDRGKTWKVAKGDMRATVGKYAIHPAVFQRTDGTIVSYLRGPDPMPVVMSKNLGETWEVQDSPFGGIGGGQKTAALRLASGAVLVMTADSKRWFGGGTLVALSLDEGKTWPHVRKVDAPVGGYMSLAQAGNGVIYLVGSRLHVAACNESWLREGKPIEAVKKP